MNNKDKKQLKGMASLMPSVVQIGKDCLSDAVIDSARASITARELIKAPVLNNANLPTKETMEDLADMLGAELIQALRAVPNEYLHYYYFSREDFAIDSVSDKTRGRFLAEQQKRFYEKAGDDGLTPYERWERTRLEREETYMATNREAAGNFERDESDLETGGYDKVALAIMHAIANDIPAELILNVANNGILPDLADDAVVEIPCRVDGSGVTPLPDAELPEHGRGMVVNAKYVEHRTIDAALNQSRVDALLALSHHPLVDSFHVAEQLLDDLVAAFPDDLAYLKETP